jgi:hypothetical protein
MKKLIFALLIFGLLPVAALAQLPDPLHEVASWWQNPETGLWEQQSSPVDPNYMAMGRLYAQDGAMGNCNKDFLIPVKITVEVAQWVNWTIGGTHWKWFVRKPGNYAGDCITGWLQSNQDVKIDFEGFEDLLYSADNPKPSVNPIIPIWYAAGDFVTPPPKTDPAWRTAAQINTDDPIIEDSQALHDGIQWKLWNYIHVVNCNSACKYEDDASITLYLMCQKPWIDRSDGFFTPR